MTTHDLCYEPPQRGYDWAKQLHPATCLVVGEVADSERDAILALAEEVRAVSDSRLASGNLHRGTYAFSQGGSWHALVMTAGKEPRDREEGRSKFLEDGHLTFATYYYEDRWKDAEPFAGSSAFRRGDMVRAKGDDSGRVGRVKTAHLMAGSYLYDVDMHGEVRQYDETALRRVDGDPRDPEFWLTQAPGQAADISLTLTWTKLSHPLTDTIYSYASSKTFFRAYQFKPVLKILTASSGRLLIADEVGLGKTIEAGLIWSELEQRRRTGTLERVLVIAPSALKLKWKLEMGRRFERPLEVLRTNDLADFAEQLVEGSEPRLHGVISLESLRTADSVLEQLDRVRPRFDLIIVDEAHYLRNRESKSHALGRLLPSWTDHLIFLSATPLNLGNDDLFNLMNLLDEGNFSDRTIFTSQLEPNEVLNDVARSLVSRRDTPRDLLKTLNRLERLQFGSTVTARPDYALLRRLLDVDRRLTDDEVARARRLLADLNVLGGVLTRTRKAEVPDSKAVREPHNIDVSWTAAEKAYYDAVYDWYMARAREMGTPPGFAMQMPLRQAASCIPASQELMRERNPELFWQEFDDVDEEPVSVDLAGLLDSPALTSRLSVDSKYDQLLAQMLQVRESGLRQVMIFSFFRRTLAYLARRLGEHFTVRVMHGGVPPAERERIMRGFREGAFEILLLSEVGSEGLDFEFCNVLVNYDLPWNPMRVEQRIGRLDRFGQAHEKIFIYNMRVPGTIETDIFQRLYDRIGVFESSIGELEPILRDQIGDITKRLLDPRLDPAGRQREMERISVAVQQRSQYADELWASRAHLSGIDHMLVEGLTDAGPDNGRFIGPGEIARILDELFRRLGGHRTRPDSNRIFRITGSDRLAARLRSSHVPEGGSRHSRSKLAAMLQNAEPLECTLVPETASRYDVELLSGRHPLIKLALEVLGDESLALPRFGSVGVPGIPDGSRYLVKLDLVETRGLRPLLELWATAVDVLTGETNPAVGDALLVALAEGTLQDGATTTPPPLRFALRRASEHAALRQREAQEARSQENAALVEGRIRARESSLDIQIANTRRTLDDLTSRSQAASIIRLHQGRLRNLQSDRLAVRDELSGCQELSVSRQAVAIILANGVGPSPSAGTTGPVPPRTSARHS